MWRSGEVSSEFTTQTILFDQELHELATLRRERDLLARLAHMFERFGGRCYGECVHPVSIGICDATHEDITCCDLRACFERYQAVVGLAKQLDERIQSR